VVVLNNSAATFAVKIPRPGHLPSGTILQDVWNGEKGVARVTDGHICGPNVPPRSGMVLVCQTVETASATQQSTLGGQP
jgi:hypothetical protein